MPAGKGPVIKVQLEVLNTSTTGQWLMYRAPRGGLQLLVLLFLVHALFDRRRIPIRDVNSQFDAERTAVVIS